MAGLLKMKQLFSKTLDRLALQLLLWFDSEPSTERVGKFAQFEMAWRKRRQRSNEMVSRG
ncbi:MAG TPA: hypothetical protein VJN64_16165 [Terriglobales bacterium]|nr:hypothetical protein [Terriglobales bacterium]